MDENKLIKIGMEVALRPVTEITENALGVLGGDWLSEKRKRNREKLQKRTREILGDNFSAEQELSPSVLTPLLTAAQEESRDELIDLWAHLISASVDPVRQNVFRRDFIATAKELEPVDVAVFRKLADAGTEEHRLRMVSGTLGLEFDQVMVSMAKLAKLGLIGTEHVSAKHPQPTPYGRQFLLAATR